MHRFQWVSHMWWYEWILETEPSKRLQPTTSLCKKRTKCARLVQICTGPSQDSTYANDGGDERGPATPLGTQLGRGCITQWDSILLYLLQHVHFSWTVMCLHERLKKKKIVDRESQQSTLLCVTEQLRGKQGYRRRQSRDSLKQCMVQPYKLPGRKMTGPSWKLPVAGIQHLPRRQASYS